MQVGGRQWQSNRIHDKPAEWHADGTDFWRIGVDIFLLAAKTRIRIPVNPRTISYMRLPWRQRAARTARAAL
jgi:hypothetical protein